MHDLVMRLVFREGAPAVFLDGIQLLLFTLGEKPPCGELCGALKEARHSFASQAKFGNGISKFDQCLLLNPQLQM